MNDERCDRDRVTAILTLADELAVMPPDHPERCYVELRFRTEARACLLEALDTIDRLEGENRRLMGVAAQFVDERREALAAQFRNWPSTEATNERPSEADHSGNRR